MAKCSDCGKEIAIPIMVGGRSHCESGSNKEIIDTPGNPYCQECAKAKLEETFKRLSDKEKERMGRYKVKDLGSQEVQTKVQSDGRDPKETA
jgi:hypothetical protein